MRNKGEEPWTHEEVQQVMEDFTLLEDKVLNMKDDMLKMMDKLDKHDMFFKQLNWKIGNIGAKPPNCS
tara:strand:- start:96 stop:299 length:204 start_codon:yes stop_codon:yes gene_type:complete